MQRIIAKLGELWPIVLFVLALTFGLAQADTTLQEHEVRIKALETTPERLAHIETTVDDIKRELDHR